MENTLIFKLFSVMYILLYIYIYIYIYIYTHTHTHTHTHKVSQEDWSIFWEVIVSVILSKKPYMNMCPIPNGFRDRAI
jgi:hypothetical protein